MNTTSLVYELLHGIHPEDVWYNPIQLSIESLRRWGHTPTSEDVAAIVAEDWIAGKNHLSRFPRSKEKRP